LVVLVAEVSNGQVGWKVAAGEFVEIDLVVASPDQFRQFPLRSQIAHVVIVGRFIGGLPGRGQGGVETPGDQVNQQDEDRER
jgi:hypothetical protein